MQVNLTDFEAKVVRTALMEYALNLQLLAPPKLENEPSTPVYPNPANTHRSSMFLVMDTANAISERLEEQLREQATAPKQNRFRETV